MPGTPELAKEQPKLFRQPVEERNALITRTVAVNRNRTPLDAFLATGRELYLNEAVVSGVPLGTEETVTMSFYCFKRLVTYDKLDEELAKLGLELIVDPIAQAALNEAEPEFADTHPNGTQWKNADGKVCYAFFIGWYGERCVSVRQYGIDWHLYWWFPVRSCTLD
jgi:hypothetical protein